MSLKDKYEGDSPNTMTGGFYPDILEAAKENGLDENGLEVRLSNLDNYHAMFLEDGDSLDDLGITEDDINYLIGVVHSPGVTACSSDVGNAAVTATGPGGRVRKG
jgi:hypothetical protein